MGSALSNAYRGQRLLSNSSDGTATADNAGLALALQTILSAVVKPTKEEVEGTAWWC